MPSFPEASEPNADLHSPKSVVSPTHIKPNPSKSRSQSRHSITSTQPNPRSPNWTPVCIPIRAFLAATATAALALATMKLFDAYYVFHLEADGAHPRVGAHYAYPATTTTATTNNSSPFTQENVAPFCFASEKWFLNSTPPSEQRGSSEAFVFILTLAQDEHVFGFTLRCPRLGEEHDRADLVPRGWEASCLITRVPGFRLFNDLLNCVRVRRAISMSAAEDLLGALYNCDISGPAPLSIRVQSTIQHVACDYTFPVPKAYDIQDIPLFTTLMTPTLLHHALGAILLERRIIVIGRHESELSAVIHGLVSLIRPFKYPHIFVPIMPHHFLAYVGSPSPYLVGILSSQEDTVNSIKDLGGVVIVDLIARNIRLTQKSVNLIPLGYVVSSTSAATSTSRANTDEDRPWADVCAPFMKSLVNAFKANNANEIRAAVLACIICLLLKDPRGNFIVEDPQLRTFLVAFKNTQIFLSMYGQKSEEGQQQLGDIGDPEFETIRGRILGRISRGGFADVRQAIGSVAIDVTQPAPSSITDPTVLDVTSNSPPKAPERESYNSIAKRSFDANACLAIVNTVWARYNDSAGRNWKHGLKAMKLLHFLLSAGSEIVVASVWNNIGQIHALTRFSTDVVGVTSRSVAKVRESAMLVYLRAVCLKELRWLRSIEGHEIIRGFKRSKTEEAVRRVPRFEGNAKSFFVELHSRTCEPPLLSGSRKPWAADMFDTGHSAKNTAQQPQVPKKQPPPAPNTDLLLDFSEQPPITFQFAPEQQQQKQQSPKRPRQPPPTQPPSTITASNVAPAAMQQPKQQTLLDLDSFQQQLALPQRPPPTSPARQQQKQPDLEAFQQQQQQQPPPQPQRPPPKALIQTTSSSSHGSRSDSPSTLLNEIFAPDSSIPPGPTITTFSKSVPPAAQDLAQFDTFLQELGVSASTPVGFEAASSAPMGNVNHGFAQMAITGSTPAGAAPMNVAPMNFVGAVPVNIAPMNFVGTAPMNFAPTSTTGAMQTNVTGSTSSPAPPGMVKKTRPAPPPG